MKCPKCGSESSGKFCEKCGSPLNAKRFCSNCGAELSGNFCPECGTPANNTSNTVPQQPAQTKVVISRGKKPSVEYLNALAKAETYSKTMYMSKQGIYDQLTSEYGEKFPADAAQYAIDNMSADWNANALQKAKTYQKSMSMSKSAIYDQLISEYGEKFTKDEAQYAIDHLDD